MMEKAVGLAAFFIILLGCWMAKKTHFSLVK